MSAGRTTVDCGEAEVPGPEAGLGGGGSGEAARRDRVRYLIPSLVDRLDNSSDPGVGRGLHIVGAQ